MTPPGEDDGELGIGAITRSGETTAPEASEAVSEVQDTQSLEGASGIAPSDASGSTSSIDAITRDLAAGAIDASEARALLIDEAVRSQLPEGADPTVVEQVRSEVAALLASDPVLDALLDPKR